ncbi:arf-GAP with Rho-GAP domain, ANK repeat and PH domain-containing protein 2-like [Cyprinodon tularosa]|uniref:arf-GAP with Rho-GAP domain, ANK repeat and PH domain-containing protein 2-like n=1 Tax=Cyprinodon tularosa TaxID=77115 RepID=UPI0018E24417|nr:arf-GAP with Rho-GAP domain, ANK repeat and PH domain-containing protein 2-like [Cyprinodon tularosa]XP_038150808.1 arf-GAP with Rho-GAP domain, ANK repeat and PH domain-containing protein 2-like [Cyprinodon tularosa]
MSESPEPRYEIEEWLLALRLSQYISIFQESGYQVVEDCRGLTDERLIEIQVLPTGHRKRILRSLEALGLQHEDGKTVKSEQEIQESVGDERKPRLYPRHVFLKDRGKAESCQHNQPKENMEYNMEGQDTIPDRQNIVPPIPAPRNLPLTQSSLYSSTCVSISKLSSSSSESLLNSEIPSDWEVPLGEQCHSNFATDNLLSVRPEDQFDFDGEMVENSIYETHPAEPRPTRSYRLRHRPVPEIPSETAMPPMERSAQTTSPEHLTGSERPTGANGIQKAPLQRTLTPIVPYGEVFLYNNPGSSPEKGAKDGLQKGFKAKMKQKKKRKKQKEKGSPPAPAVQGDDGYSTVNLHASTLPGAGLHPAFALTPETAPVISGTNGPEDESLVMVECDLYSDSVKSRETESPQPDISPYACFYGAPKQQVLKVGWLDKLSPQGNCVFQRRWVRFDGESLAYYNNEKVGV